MSFIDTARQRFPRFTFIDVTISTTDIQSGVRWAQIATTKPLHVFIIICNDNNSRLIRTLISMYLQTDIEFIRWIAFWKDNAIYGAETQSLSDDMQMLKFVLEPEPECPICLEPFDLTMRCNDSSAHLLHCVHSVCRLCMRKQITRHYRIEATSNLTSMNNIVMSCPICREKTKLQKKSIQALYAQQR